MTHIVTNMVCPSCAHLHGRPHHEGCPRSFEAHAEYEAGWRAAATMLPEVAESFAWKLDKLLAQAEAMANSPHGDLSIPLTYVHSIRQAARAEGLLR